MLTVGAASARLVRLGMTIKHLMHFLPMLVCNMNNGCWQAEVRAPRHVRFWQHAQGADASHMTTYAAHVNTGLLQMPQPSTDYVHLLPMSLQASAVHSAP